MSLKDAAAKEAVLRALLDQIEAAYKTTRAEVQELLDNAAQETGTRQISASLPDGQDVATVSLKGGAAEARITDDGAFTAWVLENFPVEIHREFITSVRAAFATKLLKQMTAAGVAEWVDTRTGVVHEVPGVEIKPSRRRTHEVRFAKTGRAAVAAAWRDGLFAADLMPQLTAVPEEETS